MARKVIAFDIDGEQHTVTPRRLSRSVMAILGTINDDLPDENGVGTEDWGVEVLAKEIDGVPPLEADEMVQDYAYAECINYFLPIISRVKSTG